MSRTCDGLVSQIVELHFPFTTNKPTLNRKRGYWTNQMLRLKDQISYMELNAREKGLNMCTVGDMQKCILWMTWAIEKWIGEKKWRIGTTRTWEGLPRHWFYRTALSLIKDECHTMSRRDTWLIGDRGCKNRHFQQTNIKSEAGFEQIKCCDWKLRLLTI